jgi:hypothetical protein
MRRLALLMPILLGCDPGYLVQLDVTVPPEVQAALSSSQPGMLMNKRWPLAQLCELTGVPFTIKYTHRVVNYSCSQTLGDGWEKMYLYQLSQADIDWFSANQPAVHCGQTSAITGEPSFGDITERAIEASWETNQAQTIAAGSGGSCDASGNYTGAVLLQLVK